jgi:hypothetical protein
MEENDNPPADFSVLGKFRLSFVDYCDVFQSDLRKGMGT